MVTTYLTRICLHWCQYDIVVGVRFDIGNIETDVEIRKKFNCKQWRWKWAEVKQWH